MKIKTILRASAVVLAASSASAGALAIELVEPPTLAAQVAAGKLPPIAKRLPLKPSIANFAPDWRTPGRHGASVTGCAYRCWPWGTRSCAN